MNVMAITTSLLNPDIVVDINDYFKTLLSVAGVMLGLAFAALTYILENGFSSFKYNRLMFLKLFILFGKQILYVLAYVVAISIIRLYFIRSEFILFLLYALFSIVFIKSVLDFSNHRGYIHTIFSSRFIPEHYGRFRAYFRSIKNLGYFYLLRIIFLICLFIIYPAVISFNDKGLFTLNDKALVVSTGLFLLFSILRISAFIPEFFSITSAEYENSLRSSENPTIDKTEPIDIDFEVEKNSLRQYLVSHGINTDGQDRISFLNGTYSISLMMDDHPEAWFNITVDDISANVFEIRSAIDELTYTVFEKLKESNADINSFVLSFHIYIENQHRNIFFRVTRSELRSLFALKLPPKETLEKIDNKLYDNLFRDM